MTSPPRLLVLDDHEGRIEAAPATERLRSLADVRILRTPLAQVSDDDLRDVRVLLPIRERTRLDAGTLDRFPALELVLQTGGHAYHLDLHAAKERGLVVTHGRHGTAARSAVPELTFGLMIGAMRTMPTAHRAMADGEWPALVGRCLAGRQLGLLGVGRHGTRVAGIAQAFGMDVVAWARTAAPAVDADGLSIPRLDLDQLLGTSDVVSIHLRLSEESRGLLDAERLRMCKPGAVLVNTARGAIVDEAALLEALRDGPIAAAGLDVFAVEPLPPDSALRSVPNVVLTPHVGWTVEEVFDEFAAIAADQLDDYLHGRLDPAMIL